LRIKLQCCLRSTSFSARFLVRNLSRYLMNKNQNHANRSIEDGNISKMIHFHLSLLFARAIFFPRTDAMHRLSM
jgi:hypothetical protein